MTSKTQTLDKSKPYATVHSADELRSGDAKEQRLANAKFEQNHQLFDANGAHLGPAGSSDPAKSESVGDPEKGTGNLAKGQIPKFFKPLEEGGGGGGKTISWPQTTEEGQEAIDEHDDVTDPDGSKRKAAAAKKKK